MESVVNYMNRLKNFLNYNQKYIIIFFVITLIYSIIVTNIKDISIYNIEDNIFEGKILSIKSFENKTQIIIKNKEKLLINYYDNINNLEIGDTIKVEGKLKKPNKNTNFNLFNYQKYLYYENIYYILDANKITKLKNNTNIFNHYKTKLQNYINSKKSRVYLNIFILSNKQYLDDVYLDSYKTNSLMHLFSISGMHISLIFGTILKLLDKVNYNRLYKYSVIIILLLFYMFLTNFTASILRSGIMFILILINKLFNLKITNKNIIMLVFIIIMLINPNYLYNTGFQLSYLISFYLILFKYKIDRQKGYIKKLLYLSFISFLISFPIIINSNFEVNILSIFINIIFIPLISYIVLPLSLLNLIIPIDDFLLFLTDIMENLSLFLANIKVGQIIFSKPSFILIIIYYIVITLFLYNKKFFLLLVILLFYHKSKIYFDSSLKITTLDVGQGDAILLKYPYYKGNILIDTGGNYNYEIAKNSIIPYLKSEGIEKINYLVLTHGDYDHMGEAINLVESIKVENVIFNCGEFNDLENDLIKVLDKKKIPYYSCIKELNIDDNKLYFLNNKNYGNENDNSSVIYTKLNNHKFLFMGDAGVEVEEDLIEKYNLKNIDVLKVGHHGSKTSSGKEFIDEIKPKYSVISVGKNNRYGHPNDNVLENLSDSKIYRTDQNGSIMFKIKNDKLKIANCAP